MKKTICQLLLILGYSFLMASQGLAAPYYYFSGLTTTSENSTYTSSVYLVTDSDTITAAQTVIDFNSTYLRAKSVSILNSRCSFWAPADPSLGFGNTPAPYFYPSSNSNKVILSCGFSYPGYTSADADGDLIANIRFTPLNQGNTSLSFDSANTLFRYIGNSLSVDSMSSFNLTIFESTPSPSASASGAPTAIPTPTASSSATSQPSSTPRSLIQVTDTLTADDLNFVEIGLTESVNQTTLEGDDLTLEVIDEDDTIPNVPILEPRPNATPFIFNLLGGGEGESSIGEDPGEVLAAQSLRELLIPGKSQADKTVVMINLISTLTFLALLAIVLWRLITITRVNRLKSRHMKDVLASELAVLQSKLAASNDPENNQKVKQEIEEALKKLNQTSK